MAAVGLPQLPPGAYSCSHQGCTDNFSSKKALFQHITGTHGSAASRDMAFRCPYCFSYIIGKFRFDKHVSVNTDCEAVNTLMETSALQDNYISNDRYQDVSNGNVKLIPILTQRVCLSFLNKV